MSKHTPLPWSAKANLHDNDGFPCVTDDNACVVFSVWDEGRTIEQAEQVAKEIVTAVNNHANLVGLIDAALKCDLLDDKDWKRKARTLLAQLDGELE